MALVQVLAHLREHAPPADARVVAQDFFPAQWATAKDVSVLHRWLSDTLLIRGGLDGRGLDRGGIIICIVLHLRASRQKILDTRCVAPAPACGQAP